MGALCCCFHVPDVQNNTVLDNSSSDDCLCPKCFFQNFVNKHRSVFTRGQIRAISSSNQQASALNSEMVLSDSPEVSWSHDVAEANAASSRYLQEQCNESNRRQEKVNSKSVQGDRIVVSNCEAGSQRQNCGLESSLDVLSLGVESIFANIDPAPDDEDVCPTCFEEYTQENPKIVAKCSHHYHLSCIYEWMERSENCPACRKLMLFDESS